MAEENILTFTDKLYRFISCGEESCRMFPSTEAVQAAFNNKEIRELRIRSKSGALDVRADLTKATFKTELGKLVMVVPSSAMKPYREEHSELSRGKKAAIV